MPLGSLLRFSIGYHFYANEAQFFFTAFENQTSSSSLDNYRNLSGCLQNIQSWMYNNRLATNSSKTEFLLLRTPRHLSKFNNIIPIKPNSTLVTRSQSACNIGVIFDKTNVTQC